MAGHICGIGRAALGGLISAFGVAYCGLEPATNHPLVFFGVEQVEEAESILREAAVAAAKAHETQGP